ncbi:MAG: ABC transporter permease [Pseudomonadota bacterium]
MSRSVRIGVAVLLVLLAIAVTAPFLGTIDPALIDPAARNAVPWTQGEVTTSEGETVPFTYRFGTDSLGRDIYSRVLYGARISLMVGAAVTVLAVGLGLVVGLLAGSIRWFDMIVMRMMDGLMAIPPILLALALVALWGSGLWTVILAITIPEFPRVVRLVRAVTLTLSNEPYVQAAVALGVPLRRRLRRHIVPSTLPALIVQASYIAASAILIEAILSFLGIGIPPEIPSWGNIMAEGRTLFRVYPHNILFPGIFLSLAILAINVMGDGLRDDLDPRLAKSI